MRTFGFWIGVMSEGILLTLPVLLAALGELVAERSGVLNIGLEGMMAVGAFAAFFVMAHAGNPVLAIVCAAAAGTAVAGLMVLISVRGGADQIVTGFALVVLAPAIAAYLYTQNSSAFNSVPILPNLRVPGIGGNAVVKLLLEQNAFYFLTILLAVLVWFILNRTRFGLESVAAGHDPGTARAKGVDVAGVRTVATLLAGAFAGLGGAALTIGVLGSFSPGVTGGRGFVAIAIVILGRWRLGWTVLGALLFGETSALELALSTSVGLPVQLPAMLPWVVVLLMLILGARSTVMPRALGRS